MPVMTRQLRVLLDRCPPELEVFCGPMDVVVTPDELVLDHPFPVRIVPQRLVEG